MYEKALSLFINLWPSTKCVVKPIYFDEFKKKHLNWSHEGDILVCCENMFIIDFIYKVIGQSSIFKIILVSKTSYIYQWRENHKPV
jgi:hypothetical protein